MINLIMEHKQKLHVLIGLAAIASVISAYTVVTKNKISLDRKPHIIFIIADDMGWNDVSFHGSDQIPTSNIDALAYNGVIFNRHYTLPMCTPSRTALMTGRYPIREGMQGFPLRAGEPRGISLNSTLLPEYLRRLGYSTNLVGKWHVGYQTKKHTPTHRGFDYFYGYYSGLITYFGHWISEPIKNKQVEVGHDFHRDQKEDLRVTYDSGYFTDLITDEAERIIRNNGNEKPLFLQISHLAVHATGADDPLEVRDSTENDVTFAYIKDPKRRKYAGMVKAMDESVGRVVTALSEMEMLENSIVIFISDNGAPTFGLYENVGSNYPLRGIKNTMFEGGVRGVACVFSPLVNAPARVSDQYVHISDWLPTLYAAAGGDVVDLKDIDGLNQWPMIVNNTKSPRKSLLVNIDETKGSESAIIGNYKLLKGEPDQTEGYYGDSGSDPSYPAYNVEQALLSKTGLAISHLQLNSVGPSISKAQQLRRLSSLRCKPTLRHANCSKLCLFNIQKDPCETQNLSKQHPEVVRALESLIDSYRKVMVKQVVQPVDPCSYPKYFNGTWMPWIADDFNTSSTGCHHPVYSFLA